jgi:hypothetical protein
MAYSSAYWSEIDHYIEIVPSGLIVTAFEGQFQDGTFEISRGTNQTITLDPVKYSIDLDGLVNKKTLKFWYYCRLIQNETELEYPRNSMNKLVDLLTIQNNYDNDTEIRGLLYNNSNSCFKSPTDFTFDSTGNVMTIKPRVLEYIPGQKYEVQIKTQYLGLDYYVKIRIDIQNVNYMPIINVRCKFIETCWTYGDRVKIQPMTQLILTSTCTDGCFYGDNLTNLTYSYKVYKYWNFTPFDNDIEEKWIPQYNLTFIKSKIINQVLLAPIQFFP